MPPKTTKSSLLFSRETFSRTPQQEIKLIERSYTIHTSKLLNKLIKNGIYTDAQAEKTRIEFAGMLNRLKRENSDIGVQIFRDEAQKLYKSLEEHEIIAVKKAQKIDKLEKMKLLQEIYQIPEIEKEKPYMFELSPEAAVQAKQYSLQRTKDLYIAKMRGMLRDMVKNKIETQPIMEAYEQKIVKEINEKGTVNGIKYAYRKEFLPYIKSAYEINNIKLPEIPLITEEELKLTEMSPEEIQESKGEVLLPAVPIGISATQEQRKQVKPLTRELAEEKKRIFFRKINQRV